MKWMKFTSLTDAGFDLWLNMALAVRISGTVNGGSYIEFNNGEDESVTDTPEEIIARGEWLVK